MNKKKSFWDCKWFMVLNLLSCITANFIYEFFKTLKHKKPQWNVQKYQIKNKYVTSKLKCETPANQNKN